MLYGYFYPVIVSAEERQRVLGEHLAFLRENLERLGIEDPEITVVFRVTHERDARKNRLVEFDLPLSEALHHQVACEWHSFLQTSWPEKVNSDPDVQVDGTFIGYLDPSGFRYKDPPSLRTALAWMVVAQWEYAPFAFDLDVAHKELASVIARGVTQEVFVEHWLPALKRVFNQSGMVSKDGYRASENYLWRAATKDALGASHPGYPECVEPSCILRFL